MIKGHGKDGKWQMANGKWQMANGKWQMANGKWQMANVREKRDWPLMPDGRGLFEPRMDTDKHEEEERGRGAQKVRRRHLTCALKGRSALSTVVNGNITDPVIFANAEAKIFENIFHQGKGGEVTGGTARLAGTSLPGVRLGKLLAPPEGGAYG